MKIMKKMKSIVRIISILLTALFIIQLLPLQSMAAETQEWREELESKKANSVLTSDVADETSIDKESPIIGEDESLRSADTKHFRKADGSYVAAVYGSPVHYEKNGKWEEVDNTLVPIVENGKTVGYEAKSRDNKITLPTKLGKNQFITMSDPSDKYTIRLGFVNVLSDKKGINFESAAPVKSDSFMKSIIGDSAELEFAAPSESAEITNPEVRDSVNAVNPDTSDAAQIKAYNDELVAIDTLDAQAKYKNVSSDTDIEYIVTPDGIKENIIINKKQNSYIYGFALETDGLTPLKNEDGSISLYEEGNDEAVFIIETPYMFDANNEVSYAVDMSIESVNSNVYAEKIAADNGSAMILSVKADAGWINDSNRVFPVTIDPTVVYNSESNILDTYVNSSWLAPGNHSSSINLYAGKLATGSFCRTYVKFNLPALPDSGVITHAQFDLKKWDVNTGSYPILVYDAYKYNWDPGTIKWSTQPLSQTANACKNNTNLPLLTGSSGLSPNDQYYNINITQAANRWYENNRNNGLVITSVSETANGQAAFHSANTLSASEKPVLTVFYYDANDHKDSWTYETADLGRSGVVYANQFNGQMTYIHNDINMSGNRMPLNISHVYNSNSSNYGGKHANMYLGKGFRLNIIEELREFNADDALYDLGYRYEFISNNESSFYFMSTPVSNKFVYEYSVNNRNNTDQVNASNWFIIKSGTNLIMEDNEGNKKTFTNVLSSESNIKRLVKIEDANTNQTSITYSNGKITQVADGVGRAATFGYDSNNDLVTITDPANRITRFEYIENTNFFIQLLQSLGQTYACELSKITYPDGKITKPQYEAIRVLGLPAGNVLKGITAADNSELILASSGGSLSSYRIDALERKGKPDGNGNRELNYTIDFNYSNNKTVVTDRTGRQDTYIFDKFGRTTAIWDKNETVDIISYNDSGSIKNKVAKTAANVCYTENLSKNHSFEVSGNWSTSNSSGNTGSASNITGTAYLGTRYASVTSNGATGLYNYYQEHTLIPNETYTLSAYVKLPSSLAASTGGALLAFYYQNASGEWEIDQGEYIKVCPEWTRNSYTFTLPSDSNGKVRICLSVENAQGTAYFDAVQLEKKDTVNYYNLLENNAFNYKTNNLPDDWGTSNLEANDYVRIVNGNSYFEIQGNSTKQKSFQQTVKINGKAGETITFGGFAKSAVLPSIGSDPLLFSLRLLVEYTDGTASTTRVNPFSNLVKERQVLAESLLLPKDCSQITYQFTWYNQSSSVQFDNPFLYIAGFGTTYNYDAYGRLASEFNGSGETINYTYSGNSSDVTNVATRNGLAEPTFTDYTYDSKHNLTSVTNADGIKTEYFYTGATTTYGMATKVKVTDSANQKQTEKNITYTSNYNYVASETDERGKTTSYAYNNNTGLVTSVTDQMGYVTAYTYNANNDAITTVTRQLGNNTTSAVQYAYNDSDLVTSISRADMSYTFEHDNFNRLTQTKVGTQSLISNIYNTNSTLNKSTFANGDYYEPVYDELDRIVKDKYNGDVKYEYAYNENDALSQIKDIESGNITWDYVYDENQQLSLIKNSSGIRAEFTYDEKGNPKAVLLKKGSAVCSEVEYSFNDKGLPVCATLKSADGGTVGYSYDSFERPQETVHTPKSTAPNVKVNTALEYLNENNNETDFVSRITHKKVSGGSESTWNDYEYVYDDKGNITEIKNNGSVESAYEYDALGQLISETVGVQTYIYTYDSAGNLLSKKNSSGTNINSYSYADTNWGDKLTAFNGNAITYDAGGNPLSYNGYTYTWQKGRQLKSLAGNGLNLSFTYNENGLRTKKTSGSTTTEFTYIGDKLMRQDTGSTMLNFLYDANGVIGVQYNGSNYYYLRNLQGDIIGIYDSNANVVARYTYDAWGNIFSVKDANGNNITSPSHIANVNPIRYRGYYYDAETKLYYLQSRYYNPEWGRFINADNAHVLDIAQSDASKTNLFVYCNNSPVMYSDPTGQTPIQAAFAALGAIAGWYLGDYVAKKLGYYSGEIYWAIRVGTIVGGAVIGWFAAGALTSILKGFIFSNPALIAKTPIFVYKFLGISVGSGSVVLGKYPLYVELAKRLGSNIFQIASNVWNSMSSTAQWNANRAFLDKIIQNGQKITLQTNASKATGYFLKEINYLLSKGYKIVENGWAMVRK